MELNFEGNPDWWNGRIPDNLILNESHPNELKDWYRKRLEPLLTKFLFPVCWSLLLLTIGIIFTLLDHRTNFSEYIGACILLLGPLTLGTSILYISNLHQDSNSILLLFKGLMGRTRFLWIIIALAMFMICIIQKPSNPLYWNLMIVPSTILWIEFFVLGSFYFSSPSAIWMAKVNFEKNIPISELKTNGWIWTSDSLTPRNTQMAIKTDSNGNFLELSSKIIDDETWIILSWWQKVGVRHDPFVNINLRGVAIPKLTKMLGYSITKFDEKMLDGIEIFNQFLQKSN